MFGLSFWEIAIIMAIALILLGPSKLPDLAKAFGKSLREFRKATEDFKTQIQDEAYREPPHQAHQAQLPRTVPMTDAVIEPPHAQAAPAPQAAPAAQPVAAAPVPQAAAGTEPSPAPPAPTEVKS